MTYQGAVTLLHAKHDYEYSVSLNVDSNNNEHSVGSKVESKMQEYKVKQGVVALLVYIGQMVVGAGMGWSAPILHKLTDPELTPFSQPITDGQASWVGSVLYVGTIIGPYASGYLSNRYGRKPSLLLGGFLTALAFIILATSVNVTMVYIGRIVTGLGTAIIAVSNLVYLGEVASANIRGILLTGTGIFGTCGTLLVYATAPYVSYAAASYIILGLTIVYIIGLFFIPESPVFYNMKGRENEAEKSLVALGRTVADDSTKDPSAKQEKAPSAASGWKDLFGVKSNRKALIITLTLNMLQQLSGVVVVVLFATTIFEQAGSTIEPNTATFIIGVTQLGACCITPFFIERVGRKVLLMLSTFACFVSLAVLGTYFFLDNHGVDVTAVGWLPLVTLIIFFLSFDLGFGIIPGTFIGEMFSKDARSTGSTFTSTIPWLFGFGVSTAFNYVVAAIGGHYAFWFFTASCAGAFIFTWIVVPETKGKTLYEIQEMLSR